LGFIFNAVRGTKAGYGRAGDDNCSAATLLKSPTNDGCLQKQSEVGTK
jgi:hypothetical protein